MSYKLEKVRKIIETMEGVVVAFSGGIDSTLLLKIAYEELGKNVIGVTLISPSVPKREIDEAKILAKNIGVKHHFIESDEISDPNYQANPSNRCYYCRKITMDKVVAFAQKKNIDFVLDGANADDEGDHRPGRKAAKELGIRSPLQEVGLSKPEIRLLSKKMGLPNWNKPAAACLSSRIPYGTPISMKSLTQIERAENYLSDLGINTLRVRHHGNVARIEVPTDDFSKIIENRSEITRAFKEIGYMYITLDLQGFRSGSMNEVL